ncbi:lipopolysaccharide assembly protein LapA domain-containing protein [Aeromicrobium massiliense]|uniref:lipopolysaccharide assembly protein LapA domain-containing protein n=1 Tax=Aeromicrobium massiliense TaxID=1464554 RepID=UPI0002DAB1FB|nr:lipopolysaccharide assembly protein LapA domain-containing protein [Aeromicrobium massiliense]
MSRSEPPARTVRVRTVVAVVLAVLALTFVFQNTGSKSIRFLFWSTSMPAWIWLLVVFVAGVVAGSLFPWFRRRARR